MIDLFKRDKLKGEKQGEVKEEKELDLIKILLSFASFSIVIVVFGIFYMGALATQGGMSNEDYEANITAVSKVLGETFVTVIMNFYDSGKENPKVFTLVFWGSIFMWFYMLGHDVWDYTKQRKKKKIKLNGAIQALGDVAVGIT